MRKKIDVARYHAKLYGVIPSHDPKLNLNQVRHCAHRYGVAPPEIVEKVRQWEALASSHGVSLPAVAMAFAALPACVARVVIGCSKGEEVANNLRFLEESAAVPRVLFREAKEAGLLPEHIPVPVE
jgi:aryl-alcohol dehydrogenase-like predicted oxidoreductase